MTTHFSTVSNVLRRQPMGRTFCAAAIGFAALTTMAPPASAGFLDAVFQPQSLSQTQSPRPPASFAQPYGMLQTLPSMAPMKLHAAQTPSTALPVKPHAAKTLPPAPVPAVAAQSHATQKPAATLRIAHATEPRKTQAAQIEPRQTKGDICCKPGEDPVAFLMHDPTLRPGDAVMTPEGIRIFEGPVASQHAQSDFSSLATAKKIASNNRAQLAQIDARVGDPLPAQIAGQKQIVAQTENKPKALSQAPAEPRRMAMADQ